MIDFYTWHGPNSRKVAIMLEEIAAPYTVKLVDITKGEQHQPDFLAFSPNNKIPAIIDHDGAGGRCTVFESGAILVYLAEKTGRFLPKAGQARADAYSWLVWSMSALGATLPQFHYFGDREAETQPAVLARFYDETIRLFKILERRLAEKEFLAGEYSIADMPTYASTVGQLPNVRKKLGERLGPTPAIERWMAAIAARPAVQRGMKVPS
ncbi:MAG: glutathione S-transferase N-terminal domain-containing protein [Rhodospirillaceae bacterium]|nr:glutathione S-transferase N-terminal domain-containing protein [Rhodospirillaceae bacterium]